MKPEQRLWKRLRLHLIRFGHFERVENGAGVGTPDVDYCAQSVEGKIELKAIAALPVRATTQVLGKSGLRKEQVVWITKRCREGGRVFVLIGVGRDLYLVRMTAHRAAVLNGMDLDHLEASSCWAHKGRGAVNYNELVRELVE